MGSFGNRHPKQYYEVVEFQENGTTLYYICVKGTQTKIQPEKPFEHYDEALEACNALSTNPLI